MLFVPYNNFSLDLSKAPMVAFYHNDQTNTYDFRVGAHSMNVGFTKDKIEEAKEAISAYQQQGGCYYWFFSNVAVNLDVVSVVACLNNSIHIEFPGGSWTSSADADNKKKYDDYIKYIQANPRPSATAAARKAKAAAGGKAAAEPGQIDEAALTAALETIDKMIGLDAAKKDIRQNIALARFNAAKVEIGMDVKPISRHMVFTGNPGTGKTTFAREVAKIYHALGFLKSDKVVEATREDLIAEYTGQTAPKVRKKMDEARGGVLFIDEAYSLVRDKSAFRDVFGTEAIDTLVAGMENMRDEMVVIVAGYPEPMKKFIDANEGLKSRFVTYISFEDYSMGQLGEIMDLMAAERGYSLAADARDHVINLLEKEKAACEKKFRRADTDADGSSFGNARDVRTLVEAAEKALAFRLDSEGAFRPDHGMTAEERKALLSTITLADVAGLSLDGIKTPAGSARAQKAEIGFGRPRSSAPQL